MCDPRDGNDPPRLRRVSSASTTNTSFAASYFATPRLPDDPFPRRRSLHAIAAFPSPLQHAIALTPRVNDAQTIAAARQAMKTAVVCGADITGFHVEHAAGIDIPHRLPQN